MTQLPEQPALVFAPNHASGDDSPDSRYRDFRSLRRYQSIDSWSCQKKAKRGDVYLFWFGGRVSCIGGIGVVSSEVDEQENDGFDWTKAKTCCFCDFRPVAFFSRRQAVTLDDIRHDRILKKWWAGKPYRGKPKRVYDAKVAERLIRLIKEKCGDSRQLKRVLQYVPSERKAIADVATQGRPTKYWLFLVMDDEFDGLWPHFVRKRVAAQHYPDGWPNEKPNLNRLGEMKRGDQVIAALRGHRFAGFGALLTDFVRSRRSLKVQRDGEVFDFAERFDCDWAYLPLDRNPYWINCHDLKELGYDIDLERGRAVKEIDRDSFNAIKNALLAAGAVPASRKTKGDAITTVEPESDPIPCGAGFQIDPGQRDDVARAAVKIVERHYRRAGWKVRNVEPLNLRYDLECTRGRTTRRVEVKGVSGEQPCFPITKNEKRTWEQDNRFVLALVTNVLSGKPNVCEFTHGDADEFTFTAISYIATKRKGIA